jgi:phosphoribosylcarboxyaminoimidazole (NCAIR) mutase
MRMRCLDLVLILMCGVAVAVVAAGQAGSVQAALESARKTTVIDGDLATAIKQYQARRRSLR